MILRTQRSPVAAAVDATLTFLAWIGFTYLIANGIIAALDGKVDGPPLPFWSALLPTINTLLIYVIAAIVNGALLITWARYNRLRFRGLDRRRPFGALADKRCSLSFCSSETQLSQLQSCRIGVVHHDAQGLITGVEAKASRLFVVPDIA